MKTIIGLILHVISFTNCLELPKNKLSSSQPPSDVVTLGSALGEPKLKLNGRFDAVRFKSIFKHRNEKANSQNPRDFFVFDDPKSNIQNSGQDSFSEPLDPYDFPASTDVTTTVLPSNFTSNQSAAHHLSSTAHSLLDHDKPCSAELCNKAWRPVCDNRNRTHKNVCLFKFYACKIYKAENTRVEIAYEGKCMNLNTSSTAIHEESPEDCPPCPTASEPLIDVCDNHNITHHNLCHVIWFNCILRRRGDSLRVISHIGKCNGNSRIFDAKDEICPEICILEDAKVCSNDKRTFRSFCEFQKFTCNQRKNGLAHIDLRYMRGCDEPEAEPTQSEPKVNSADSHFRILIPTPSLGVEDFETSTESIFAGSGTELDDIDHFGFEIKTMINEEIPITTTPTIPLIDTTTTSTSIEDENFECPKPKCELSEETSQTVVCDSRGKLHENICEFTYARCQAAKKGIFLSVQEEEKCTTNNCQFTCSSFTRYRYICGTDFVTYKNMCEFKKQKCLLPSLEILFKGRCEECLTTPCPKLPDDAPDGLFVCDSEGMTRTICEFQMLNCIINKDLGINFTINHVGRCAQDKLLEQKLNLNTTSNVTDTIIESYQLAALSTLSIGETSLSTTSAPMMFNGEICPSECDNIYSPVCGSDDISYTNLCFLQDARCRFQLDIQIVYAGECCDMVCPNNFDPVCDNENVTHKNLCYFGKQRCMTERITGKNISIVKYDVCNAGENVCNFECPKEYTPICASNGQTIVNMCELERLNCFVSKNVTIGQILTVDYNGTCCPETKKCGFEFAPVCDSNYTTHTNECIFRQKACIESRRHQRHLAILYPGQCCDRKCSSMRAPVCDGAKTHQNLCTFKAAQCEAERRGEILQLAYSGQCCTTSKICTKTGKVCDSEGQTHENICKFRQKKCIVSKTTKKTLSVVHAGQCCLLKSCTKSARPVCDDRGGTHASLCHFQNTKCIHDKIHPQKRLQLAYLDRCCENNCSDEFGPVCDQHGRVHRNRCFFRLKACEMQKTRGEILLEMPCSVRV